MFENRPTPIQRLTDQLDIKRLDLVHPHISGNKFYKLKYNLIEAQQQGFSQILTFGGAYSNHIAATAYAAHLVGFKSIGIIRGEELQNKPLNPTLKTAQKFGMTLVFISRIEYKRRHCAEFLAHLQQEYPAHYIIPEGGTNSFAVKGCMEILDSAPYDFICCPVGTGGTITGLIEATDSPTQILGFSALKGVNYTLNTTKSHWSITDQYCFGGYAKFPPSLKKFMQEFEQRHQILLDPIYTAKMMYGITDLIEKDYFPKNSRILAIHTGGLQGRDSLI